MVRNLFETIRSGVGSEHPGFTNYDCRLIALPLSDAVTRILNTSKQIKIQIVKKKKLSLKTKMIGT